MKVFKCSVLAVLCTFVFSETSDADRPRSGAVSKVEASPVRPRSAASAVLPNLLPLGILKKLQSMPKQYTPDDVLKKFTGDEILYVLNNGIAIEEGIKVSELDKEIDAIANHDAFSRANLARVKPL